MKQKKQILSVGPKPVLRADDTKTEVAEHITVEKALSPPWLYPTHFFDELYVPYVLNRTMDCRPTMAELYRVAKRGALLEVTVPAGSSDDAWMNPDYMRPWFINTFLYFQRAMQPEDNPQEYDWLVRAVYIRINEGLFAQIPDKDQLQVAMTQRNVAQELCAVMEAIKPAGPAGDTKRLKLPRLTVQPMSARIVL